MNSAKNSDSLVLAADQETARTVARVFLILLPLQAALAGVLIFMAVPSTWIGASGLLVVHQIAIAALGLGLCGLSIPLLIARPADPATRLVVGGVQLAFSGLLIHASGGRVETHFHIFASLAILAFYRDYGVILVATAVTGLDHLIRGYGFPISIFGDPMVMFWHPLEHIAWVIFMDTFVLIGIAGQKRQVLGRAQKQREVEILQGKSQELLARAVDQMRLASDLGKEVLQAQNQTDEIRQTAQDLLARSERLSDSVRASERAEGSTAQRFAGLQQASQRQTSVLEATLDSLDHLVGKADENAKVAAQRGKGLETLREDGRTVEEDIRRTVASLATLSDAGREIRAIVEVISNVAQQTSLLSLNAAIEAAHAGASGQGFSVVADEIRKLSEQTGGQVKQIHRQVDLIVQELLQTSTWGREIDAHFGTIVRQIGEASHAFKLIEMNTAAVAGDVQTVRRSQGELVSIAQDIGTAVDASAHDQAVVQAALQGIFLVSGELDHLARQLDQNAAAVAGTVSTVRNVADRLGAELQSLT